MVEVFKTNVGSSFMAQQIIDEINAVFPAYRVNFDLEDTDRILRVECGFGEVNVPDIVHLLGSLHFHCEVLPD